MLYTPNSNPDCNSKHSSDISVAKSSAATVQLSQLPANATSRGNLNSNDNEVIPVKSAANIVVPTCSVADRHQLEQELQKQQCSSYPKYRDSIGRYGGTRSGGSRQWQWQEHGSQLDNMRFEAYLMSRSHEDSVPRAWDSNANESVAEDGEQNAVRTGEDGPGRGSTSSRERAVDIDAQELLDFGDAATLEDIMLMEAIQLSMQLHAGNSSDAGEEEH